MPVGFTVDEQSYYYKKNAQGDIVAIIDGDGVEVAGYTYDAWGNVTSISGDEQLAENNPFRYRGYYQDNESGFFYLQSRYYDSIVGRFLNADDIMIIHEIKDSSLYGNLYAYTENNPINMVDYDGKFLMAIPVLASIILAAFAAFMLAAILLHPDVQRALVALITAFGQAIVSAFEAVAQAIDTAVKKARTKIKNNIYHIHHIVAQTAVAATSSRIILYGVGISVHSTHNLAAIKANLHQFLHTSAYYGAVNAFLSPARGSYQKVVLALNTIRTLLLVASAATP